MAHFKLIGPGTDGLYKYGGATIELSSVGNSHWWATVRFKSQEIDFEARSSEGALEKAMGWVDAAPEHPHDFYGKPRPLGEAKRPGSKPKYRPSKAKKHLKVARVVPSHGTWRVEFEDNFSIQVHGGSGRSDLLYAMKPIDMSYEGRSPGPETRRDYQYLALKAVLGDRSADFVIDHDGDVMAYLKDAGAVGEARRPKITTVTYSMPVYWASYLINGDASGIDDDEIKQADAAIEDIGLGAPVDVSDSDFRHRGDYGSLAGDYADYTFLDHGKSPRETREHRVADFNTLEHLVEHAASELGATHVSGAGPTTKIYFPRGGEYPYEAASVRRKGGYWHADGPGAREGVKKLPAGARPISGGHVGRRAAEAPLAQDTIHVASGVEVRRMGIIERGKHYRHVDGWAVVVDGRAWQPWMPKKEALALAKKVASDRAKGIATEARRPAKNLAPTDQAQAAGEQYAVDQIQSEHFDQWVHEQLVEAAQMAKRDPDSVLPLETPNDARKIARNMLQQLEWDMKRDGAAQEALGSEATREDVDAFYKGAHKALQDSVPWLADTLLTMSREIRSR